MEDYNFITLTNTLSLMLFRSRGRSKTKLTSNEDKIKQNDPFELYFFQNVHLAFVSFKCPL